MQLTYNQNYTDNEHARPKAIRINLSILHGSMLIRPVSWSMKILNVPYLKNTNTHCTRDWARVNRIVINTLHPSRFDMREAVNNIEQVKIIVF